jgi:uncharacterized protein YxeA
MKKILKVFVIVLLIMVALFCWSWFSAKKKLADYVLKVQPGMQLTEAQSYAKHMGLKYVASTYKDVAGHYRDLVTATGVMGRYVCEIQHDGAVVIKTTKRFQD